MQQQQQAACKTNPRTGFPPWRRPRGQPPHVSVTPWRFRLRLRPPPPRHLLVLWVEELVRDIVDGIVDKVQIVDEVVLPPQVRRLKVVPP